MFSFCAKRIKIKKKKPLREINAPGSCLQVHAQQYAYLILYHHNSHAFTVGGFPSRKIKHKDMWSVTKLSNIHKT